MKRTCNSHQKAAINTTVMGTCFNLDYSISNFFKKLLLEAKGKTVWMSKFSKLGKGLNFHLERFWMFHMCTPAVILSSVLELIISFCLFTDFFWPTLVFLFSNTSTIFQGEVGITEYIYIFSEICHNLNCMNLPSCQSQKISLRGPEDKQRQLKIIAHFWNALVLYIF